jgi:hypothetical protein
LRPKVAAIGAARCGLVIAASEARGALRVDEIARVAQRARAAPLLARRRGCTAVRASIKPAAGSTHAVRSPRGCSRCEPRAARAPRQREERVAPEGRSERRTRSRGRRVPRQRRCTEALLRRVLEIARTADVEGLGLERVEHEATVAARRSWPVDRSALGASPNAHGSMIARPIDCGARPVSL